jgi:MFS family permease
MLGCTRGFYAIAVREEGPAHKAFVQLDKATNAPYNAANFALLVTVLWLAYFTGGQFFGWFGDFAFDSSELPIVTIYPLYVPILVAFMLKAKDVHPVKRFVLPILSIFGAAVLVSASIISHKMANVWYLIVFAVIMGIGALYYKGKRDKAPIEKFGDWCKAKISALVSLIKEKIKESREKKAVANNDGSAEPVEESASVENAFENTEIASDAGEKETN